MTPQESSGSALDLGDVIPFAAFCREAEKRKLASRATLQWWLRHRAQNGLLASGAVVEKRINPTSTKPMLFVVKPRFIDWLTNSHPTAA